jgi:glycosyltransferase involved in cell wall biosynthesis
MSQKLLIFIVAYNAQAQIEKVLERIPSSILNSHDYEILIIDDASKDETFSIAKHFQQSHRNYRLKVLFNPDNQGYGGNQKLGYHNAVKNSFDAVVLLHGDGQYAPELILEMVAPIFAGQADAVFGSRMLLKGAAIKGGMPFYKFIGNKILTWCQNKILKTALSEFHSGYRAYSVKALQRIPFQRNSNNFHFDTQIIIQLLLARQRIKEIPIPTYYGSEICHVNGIAYAGNVIKASLLSKLHAMSILYQREYDIETDNTYYSPKLDFDSSHTMAIAAVAEKSRVLDLGANEGEIAKKLKEKGCRVVGVDFMPIKNRSNFDEFLQMNLNELEKLPAMDDYDYILMLDILEHLENQELFLDTVREKSKRKRPTVVITTPNIAFIIIRLQLLFSNFNYGKQGILDLTHRRLFTFVSLKKTCEQSGYRINTVKGIPAPFPKALGNNFWGNFFLSVNHFLILLNKSLFSYQIYMEITPMPVVSELLEYSIVESEKRNT